MGTPDPSFPSFSLVLSQTSASTNHSFIVFPWTSISYEHPAVVPPAPLAPPPPPPPPPAHVHVPYIRRLMAAIRRFLAAIVAKLKARVTA